MMAESHEIDVDRLISCLRKRAGKILADRPVILAYLHGSRVSGDALPTSDIDIAIIMSPDLTLSTYDRTLIEFDIAAEYEKECNLSEVDVRSIDSAPLTVQGKVITDGILIYSRNEEFRVAYEVTTRKRYFDFLPVECMMRDAFLDHVRKHGLTIDKRR